MATKPELLLVCPMMSHVMQALEGTYRLHKLYQTPKPDALLAEVGARIRAIGTDGHAGADRALMESRSTWLMRRREV